MLCIAALDYFKPLHSAHFQRFRFFRKGLESEIDYPENHGGRACQLRRTILLTEKLTGYLFIQQQRNTIKTRQIWYKVRPTTGEIRRWPA